MRRGFTLNNLHFTNMMVFTLTYGLLAIVYIKQLSVAEQLDCVVALRIFADCFVVSTATYVLTTVLQFDSLKIQVYHERDGDSVVLAIVAILYVVFYAIFYPVNAVVGSVLLAITVGLVWRLIVLVKRIEELKQETVSSMVKSGKTNEVSA